MSGAHTCSNFCGTVYTDLMKEDPNSLPDPNKIVGGMMNMAKDDWPKYNDADREAWLREVPEYRDLLMKFTKEVLLDNEFFLTMSSNVELTTSCSVSTWIIPWRHFSHWSM